MDAKSAAAITAIDVKAERNGREEHAICIHATDWKTYSWWKRVCLRLCGYGTWKLEKEQPLECVHGVDVEDEILDILAKELAEER